MIVTFLISSDVMSNDSNISTQHIATLLGAACCARLATLWRHVGTCWVLLAQVWKWSNFSCSICGCCMIFTRLARFVQQCCTRACALVRFTRPNMSQHVATGWPNARNMLCPTMLRYVASKCCDRLAGALYTQLLICQLPNKTDWNSFEKSFIN